MGPSLPVSYPRLAAILTAAAAGFVAVDWGTHAAGGADSYGYISQARAWLEGGPPIAEPLAVRIRVHEAAWVASPLGWRPGIHAGELVPVYPPGLPWLMALLISLTGSAGEFAVTPIFAIVCVAATYRLARQLSSAAVAALAAALLATNPSFLYQSVQPMSDVPVTGLWVACLVLLGGDRAWRWSAAGVLAGVAVLVRPNLVPPCRRRRVVGRGVARRPVERWHRPH